MDYQTYLPAEALKPYVRYFWTLRSRDTNLINHHIKTVVDDTSGILFQHHNGKSCLQDSIQGTLPLSVVYGLTIEPTITLCEAQFSITGVDFYPQTFHTLFQSNAAILTNQKVDLTNFAPKELTDKLLETQNQLEQIKLLSEFLITKVNRKNKTDLTVKQGINSIKAGNFNLNQLQKHLQISERQLERKFNQSIGISPKTLIRITRFQSAIQEMRSGNPKNLNDIVFKFNYADQSHFIKEFKEFSGYTPKKMLSQNDQLLSKLILLS